jgi:hypothetical protein
MDGQRGSLRRMLLLAASCLAMLIGLGTVVIAMVLGDCSAFGGRCPDEPPPLLDDDVFGMAAFGAFIATAVPVTLLARPRVQAGRAIAIGVAAALLVGLIARAAAAS